MSTAASRLTLEALATRLGELEREHARKVADLEAANTTLREELVRQRDEIARLQADRRDRPKAADPPALIVPASVRRGRDEQQGPQQAPSRRRTSRRKLLRLGGAAAAAGLATAAGAAAELARPGVAHASGVPWQTGIFTVDVETAALTGAGYPSPDVLQVRMGTGSVYQPTAALNVKAGLAAYDATGASTGIGAYGSSEFGKGVLGNTDWDTGVYGQAVHGTGVYGTSTEGIGVTGWSGNSAGVAGHSDSNVGGFFYGGLAPLLLWPASAPGAPTSGNHRTGELWVDNQGTLWICAGMGTPGTWQRLTGVQPGYTGGAINFLPVPIRLLDTRAGAPAGNLRPNAPVAYHATLDVPAAGVTYLGQTIPSGATAVFGLLVAALAPGVNPGDGSSAICWATGQPRPLAVNVVFNPQDLHGAYTSDFTLVQTGAGGDISIYSQPINVGVAVDYIFDCFGFVM